MGYDIAWWRYSDETERDHFDTYGDLMDVTNSAGVEALPVDENVAKVQLSFPGTQVAGRNLSRQGEAGAFHLSVRDKLVFFSGYGYFADDLGKLVDIMSGFGCPAFDPQSGERHEIESKS